MLRRVIRASLRLSRGGSFARAAHIGIMVCSYLPYMFCWKDMFIETTIASVSDVREESNGKVIQGSAHCAGAEV